MAEDTKKIEKSMGELSEHISKAQVQNKQLANYNTYLTIAIVAVVIIFLYGIYSSIKGNFTGEKVMTAMGEYGPQILPEVSDAVVEIVTQVSPTYSAMFQKKAIESMPTLATTADKELVTLSDNISKKATETLRQSLINVVEAQKKIIKEGFPGIEDAKIEEGLKSLEQDLEKDFMEVCEYIINNSIDEFVSLKKTVDSFEDKSLPDDELDLSVLFLHNLIQLADQEMMTKFEETKKGGK